ncbi:MAG: thiol peroxidase [Pyramidobacter sp.]|jgi:thiol peroxidase
MQERKGIVTMGGNPITLVGAELKVGDKAPDFKVLDTAMAEKSLKDYEGKIKVISVTPSLDTPVCDLQATWFNEDVDKLGDVYVLNVSMDLPFALKRYCAAKGFDKVATLSDHRDASFGTAYGVLIKERRLLARSVFVLDRENVIRYIELVPEATHAINYDALLEAVTKLAK